MARNFAFSHSIETPFTAQTPVGRNACHILQYCILLLGFSTVSLQIAISTKYKIYEIEKKKN